VVPWHTKPTSLALFPDSSRISRIPCRMPTDASSGVVGTLWNQYFPSTTEASVRSVNVPPVSMPIQTGLTLSSPLRSRILYTGYTRIYDVTSWLVRLPTISARGTPCRHPSRTDAPACVLQLYPRRLPSWPPGPHGDP